jgi:hypothetical protein
VFRPTQHFFFTFNYFVLEGVCVWVCVCVCVCVCVRACARAAARRADGHLAHVGNTATQFMRISSPCREWTLL